MIKISCRIKFFEVFLRKCGLKGNVGSRLHCFIVKDLLVIWLRSALFFIIWRLSVSQFGRLFWHKILNKFQITTSLSCATCYTWWCRKTFLKIYLASHKWERDGFTTYIIVIDFKIRAFIPLSAFIIYHVVTSSIVLNKEQIWTLVNLF